MKKQKEVSRSQSSNRLTRRSMIQGAAALAAGTAASSVLSPAKLIAAGKASEGADPYVQHQVNISASPRKNIVETDSGKVFGYDWNGVITFRGIPYGASTGGKNRFMPPVKPEPWAGVRSALYWGPVAPQPYTSTLDGRRSGWSHDEEAFMFRWEDGHDSEDCLRINVWTSSINDNAKRPVMLWLHGGGFVAGSDQELRMYPGEGLVRRGDVVVVSINHRLGVLGFSNLMEYGDQYASSPNVGMLDIAAALQWVKTNISNFGGDPNNVLIFGQSGGGGKVSTLMAMPAAKGLFHRAVVESGSLISFKPLHSSARLTAGVLAELDLHKNNISRIQEIPYQQIVEAALHSQRVSQADDLNFGLGWAPSEDGRIIPKGSWDPKAPELSANVPLIVGNNLNEFFNPVQMEDASLQEMTMAEARKRLSGGEGGVSFFRTNLGHHTDHIIDLTQKAFPNATPFWVFSIISAMATMRLSALTQCDRKAALGAAPAYNYWFQWKTPILNGLAGAYHTGELPFVFYNMEVCATMTGGGPEALAMGARMAGAWMQFARTGNPNFSGIPHWPVYDPKTKPTMIFDNQCRTENDPNSALREAITEAVA